MSDDAEKEVADKEAQTDYSFRPDDSESTVDFRLLNRGTRPPQDGATTSAPEELPPEPETVAKEEAAVDDVGSGVFDVEGTGTIAEGQEDEEPEIEPVPVEETEIEEAQVECTDAGDQDEECICEEEGEVVGVDEAKQEADEVQSELEEATPESDGIEPEIDEVKPEDDEVKPEVDEVKPEVDEVKSEEFVDARDTVDDGGEVEMQSMGFEADAATVGGDEAEAEGENPNDKETQTVFGYDPDASLTTVAEELRTKRPHAPDESPADEPPSPAEDEPPSPGEHESVAPVKAGPPPPVVLKLHLVVETGTERVPLDLEITIDNLGAAESTPSEGATLAFGLAEEQSTRDSDMQTALSFHDAEQNLPDAEPVDAEPVDAEPATPVSPGEVSNVDDYNFLGMLDSESVASDLSRDVFTADVMTDEDLMVEPDLVPDQYVQALSPLSDTDVASFYGEDTEFPDVTISRVASAINTSSTLQVIGPATVHWGLVIQPADGVVSTKPSTTDSCSAVSMISTIHQLRHENAVSHLDRIDIDDAGSHSTASSFFSVNGDPLSEEIYAVRTRVIFQIRSTIGEQRSTDGRFHHAPPISLRLEPPLPSKPSQHVATVELADDDASTSHVTFHRDADERRESLLPGGELEFSVDVDELPTRLLAQLDGELVAEPLDVREGHDRVMRLDQLEVTARVISEPVERKGVLKHDEAALKGGRVNALQCTVCTEPNGASYSQAMEPSGSPLLFYLPVAGGQVRATLAVVPQPEPEETSDGPEVSATTPEDASEEVSVAAGTEAWEEEEEAGAVEADDRDSQSVAFIGQLLDEVLEEAGRTAHTPPTHPASEALEVKPLVSGSPPPQRMGVDGDRCRDRAYEMIVTALEAYEQGIAPLTDALLEISRKARELGLAPTADDMPYASTESLVSLHHCPCLDPVGTPLPKGYHTMLGVMQRSGGSPRQHPGLGGRRSSGHRPRQQGSATFCYRQDGAGYGPPALGAFRFGHQFAHSLSRSSDAFPGREDSSDECELCRPRCSLPPLSPLPSRRQVAQTSPAKSGSLLSTPAASEPASVEPDSEPEPAQEPEEEMGSANLEEE